MKSINQSVVICFMSVAAATGYYPLAIAQNSANDSSSPSDVVIFLDPSVENGLLPALKPLDLDASAEDIMKSLQPSFENSMENEKGYQHSFAKMVGDCFWQRDTDACKSVARSSDGFTFALISARNPALVSHSERRLDFACENFIPDSCEARSAIAAFKTKKAKGK